MEQGRSQGYRGLPALSRARFDGGGLLLDVEGLIEGAELLEQ
ncbi:hypothetical protein [Streptomyces sp. CL12-4]|nr:hypothetical protein [Streptomyces sp. CL12-4]